jgi:uncharacterized protein YndB with AHSA1/START domain
MVGTDRITWPDRYDPRTAPVYVWNELDIPAPPADVWAWLIRAQQWPAWYPNSADVRFILGAPPDLALGTKFSWKTFGVRLESTVRELVPYERLAWDARGRGIDAYHAWLLVPTVDGCHVVTAESQRGWLARLQNLFLPTRMFKEHQIWLERLSDKVVRGGC